MTDTLASQNFSNPSSLQETFVSSNDITTLQEQCLPIAPPKSLVEWLVRINQRYLAVDRSDHHDSS